MYQVSDYTCGRVHVGVYMWVCTCGCAHVGVHMWVCTCGRAHVGVHMWACTCGRAQELLRTYVGTWLVSCCRELIGSHPGNFATVMRGVVNNELGQWRSPSNMALISMMIHSWPEDSAKVCACV